MRRPGSLAEVAAWSRARRDFWNHLADFLDQFYLERRLDMLKDEPARLANKIDDGDIADAYLAATAVFAGALPLDGAAVVVAGSGSQAAPAVVREPAARDQGHAPPGKPRALPRAQPVRE